MMDKARNNPSVTTLSRIIQVVKSVFIEKQEAKKVKKEGKKGDGEDEEMEEQKVDPKAHRSICIPP